MMPHHRTYLHSQHLRSPFRNLYSHLSLSLVPRVTETNHLAWAVPFHPPFSISDLHSLAHCPLGGSLPASILHSRSPLTRRLPFGRFPSSLYSPFPISIRTHLLLLLFALNPTLPWAVPFRLPFPFSDLRFGARRRSARHDVRRGAEMAGGLNVGCGLRICFVVGEAVTLDVSATAGIAGERRKSKQRALPCVACVCRDGTCK